MLNCVWYTYAMFQMLYVHFLHLVTLFIPGAAPPMDTAVVAIAVGIVGAVVVAILIAVFIFCIVCLIRR